MQKILFDLTKSFWHVNLSVQWRAGAKSALRTVTTNSAIHRGIRRSRKEVVGEERRQRIRYGDTDFKSSEKRRRSRYEDTDSRYGDEDNSQAERMSKVSKPRFKLHKVFQKQEQDAVIEDSGIRKVVTKQPEIGDYIPHRAAKALRRQAEASSHLGQSSGQSKHRHSTRKPRRSQRDAEASHVTSSSARKPEVGGYVDHYEEPRVSQYGYGDSSALPGDGEQDKPLSSWYAYPSHQSKKQNRDSASIPKPTQHQSNRNDVEDQDSANVPNPMQHQNNRLKEEDQGSTRILKPMQHQSNEAEVEEQDSPNNLKPTQHQSKKLDADVQDSASNPSPSQHQSNELEVKDQDSDMIFEPMQRQNNGPEVEDQDSTNFFELMQFQNDRLGVESEDLAAISKPTQRRRNKIKIEDQDLYNRKSSSTMSLQPLPYTTPASEFLYGTSVVKAALGSSRRKLYKLFIYRGENRKNIVQDMFMEKRAIARGVEIVEVDHKGLARMDQASRGRPHNGYVLEASPLPKLPVTYLQEVNEIEEGDRKSFTVDLDFQTIEDEHVNGTNSKIIYRPSSKRYPFILLLDGIVDPGNLGSILRTAYFIGADAVVLSKRNCASISPVALKASAGAAEYVKIFSADKLKGFVNESRKSGWKFYAGVAPAGNNTLSKSHNACIVTVSTLGSPLLQHPCVLMLGGEGEGLSPMLLSKADVMIGVEGHKNRHHSIDSLNVSVAAGLLCEAFFRNPTQFLPDINIAEKNIPARDIEAEQNRLF